MNTTQIETSQINLRVPKILKEQIYETLKNPVTTPSDAIRDYFEHIVKERKVPFKRQVVSDEDMELLAIAKERLANMTDADVIKGITPNDLLAQHPSRSST